VSDVDRPFTTYALKSAAYKLFTGRLSTGHSKVNMKYLHKILTNVNIIQ